VKEISAVYFSRKNGCESNARRQGTNRPSYDTYFNLSFEKSTAMQLDVNLFLFFVS
jgi:hypothetical protein